MLKYIVGLLTISFFYLLISDAMNQKSATQKRLECHRKSTTFEFVYKKELLESMQDAIKSGNVKIKSEFKLSEHMLTKLASHITLTQVDEMIQKQIDLNVDSTKYTDKKLLIDYYIYENDKEDPGKKTAKSKLYAGYLVFNFFLEGEKIYYIQIDFMNIVGKDIEEKVGCMMKSVLTL